MTANDEDGGEAELWNIVELMGYNRQLKLQKVWLRKMYYHGNHN